LDPEWHEAMVNANIDIFEMSYEESVSCFKSLENLQKISCNHGPGPATILVNNKKCKSVTSNVDKSSKNPKASNMWCQYFDKNNHNHSKADCRAIAKFKQQNNHCLESKSGSG
jgi:hypothetical protein